MVLLCEMSSLGNNELISRNGMTSSLQTTLFENNRPNWIEQIISFVEFIYYKTYSSCIMSCISSLLCYFVLKQKNFWTSIFLYWGLHGCLLLNTLNNNMHGNYLFCAILVYHIDFPFDVAWRHQAIAWINADLSSVRSSDNYLNVILQEIPRLLITKNSLPITYPNKSRASVRNYGTAT